MLFDYLAESVVSGNKIESTSVSLYPFDSPWRLYSDPALQIGIHVGATSEDVSGAGNEITDPRLCSADRLVIEPGATNISLGLAAPSSGLHEGWNCAAVGAFTTPGTLTGDHSWTINANNFEVAVLDDPLLRSRAFGRTASGVLSGGSGSGVDKHTAALPQTLSPGASPLTIHARFVFAGLTTQGSAAARLGIEETASGELYMIEVNASTAASPVTFFARNSNNSTSIGSPGDQDTSGVWELVATFTRTSSTSTTVDYVVRRPNGAPYTGTATIATALGSTVGFDQSFFTFKRNARIVFDAVQAMTD